MADGDDGEQRRQQAARLGFHGPAGGGEEPEQEDRSSAGLYGSRVGGNMVRAAVAEAIGAALLVFAGTAVAVSAILDRPIAGGTGDSLAVGVAFALALVALVGALGHVSGAHLNPAVTLALAATRKFPTASRPS